MMGNTKMSFPAKRIAIPVVWQCGAIQGSSLVSWFDERLSLFTAAEVSALPARLFTARQKGNAKHFCRSPIGGRTRTEKGIEPAAEAEAEQKRGL